MRLKDIRLIYNIGTFGFGTMFMVSLMRGETIWTVISLIAAGATILLSTGDLTNLKEEY